MSMSVSTASASLSRGSISPFSNECRVLRPKYLCPRVFSRSFRIFPRTLMPGQYSRMAASSLSACCFPETLLRITPAILTSGSKSLNPRMMAAALLVSDPASTTRTTGNPSSFARYAVDPTSPSPVNPS